MLKKVLYGLLAIGLVGLAMTANAGMFTSISGFVAKEIKPDNFYTVDVAGENVRVYEWTPVGASYMQCVSMFTESSKKSPNTQCFEKKGK